MRKAMLPVVLLASLAVAQQPGSLDLSFNPDDVGYGTGDGAYLQVYASASQPDGRVIVGGAFLDMNGHFRRHLARFEPDGMLDMGFMPIFNGAVRTILVQPDGRIVVGGEFTMCNEMPALRLVRLEPDGTTDITFATPGAPSPVHAIARQSNGSLVVAGMFQSWGGEPRPGIVRLLSNGDLDLSFVPNIGPFGSFDGLAIQPDQRILAGGVFNHLGNTHIALARFTSTGLLDQTLTVEMDAAAGLVKPVLQADGRILVSGLFSSINGTPVGNIARVMPNGTLDPSFDAGSGFNGPVYAKSLGTDGSFVVSGNFTEVDGQPRTRLARLTEDGSLDLAFDPGQGTDGEVRTVLVDADGSVFIAGLFSQYDGAYCRSYAKLTTTGQRIMAYARPGGINYPVVTGSGPELLAMVVRADGRLLIAAQNADAYNGTPVLVLFQTLPDGALDTTFNSPVINGLVHCMALQPDGRVVIGGSFTSCNGVPCGRIARIMPDGSLDPSFDPGEGADDIVHALALQADGKVVLGGAFNTVDGVVHERLARLNADGVPDAAFQAGAGDVVRSLAIQPDGHILVGGVFTTINGLARNRIARLLPDGAIDPGFMTGTGASAMVRSFTLLPDGRILAIGEFLTYQAVSRPHIMRLWPDGALDMDFDAVVPPMFEGILSMALEPSGRVLIGGSFTSVGGVDRARIARLLPDGAVDMAFDTGEGADGRVQQLLLTSNGNIIVAGRFMSVGDIGRNRIARLFGGLTVGVTEQPRLRSPRLHPNPTNDLLTIQLDASAFTNGHLRVVATDGGVVMEQRMSGPREVLDVQRLVAGAYTVELVGPGGDLMVERFIKE
jgi:uncharacterized delta-60 repeat protein